MLRLRCFLFFPGNRPELLEKAVATGADGVCPDLEDAVGPEAKDGARATVVELLARETTSRGDDRVGDPDGPDGPSLRPTMILRINAPETDVGARDLEALAGAKALPDLLLVPKVVGPGSLEPVDEALGSRADDVGLIPLIETARGLAAVEEIAAASDRIVALMLGGHDLSLELGARPTPEALLYARSRIVHAAALAGVDALDMPLLEVGDPDELRDRTRAARDLGFTGKAAIHPEQVEPIQEVFTPTPEEVEEARRVVEASEAAGGNAALLDGKVVDRPILEAARRVLARAGEAR